jgi:Holliday junction resolvase YEN1
MGCKFGLTFSLKVVLLMFLSISCIQLLRPTGEAHSLTKLAVQSGFVDNCYDNRAYRIGIDASIWFFHAQGGREGENPELRTLFFRCAR